MFISINTERKWINDAFDAPFLGPYIILLIAIAPIPIMFMANGLFNIVENDLIERINALITGIWNILLTFFFRITIRVLFIPCWILFMFIGIYRYLVLG